MLRAPLGPTQRSSIPSSRHRRAQSSGVRIPPGLLLGPMELLFPLPAPGAPQPFPGQLQPLASETLKVSLEGPTWFPR